MGRLATPHTQSLIILALADHGEWSGTRKGVKMRLRLSAQPDLDDKRITWTAYTVGNWRHRIRGQAGTAFEALSQIEHALRKAFK
jgi:hypothetical protein